MPAEASEQRYTASHETVWKSQWGWLDWCLWKQNNRLYIQKLKGQPWKCLIGLHSWFKPSSLILHFIVFLLKSLGILRMLPVGELGLLEKHFQILKRIYRSIKNCMHTTDETDFTYWRWHICAKLQSYRKKLIHDKSELSLLYLSRTSLLNLLWYPK